MSSESLAWRRRRFEFSCLHYNLKFPEPNSESEAQAQVGPGPPGPGLLEHLRFSAVLSWFFIYIIQCIIHLQTRPLQYWWQYGTILTILYNMYNLLKLIQYWQYYNILFYIAGNMMYKFTNNIRSVLHIILISILLSIQIKYWTILLSILTICKNKIVSILSILFIVLLVLLSVL